MRRNLCLLVLLVVATASRLAADDTDIFTAQKVQPNVVILIDTSQSMDENVGGVQKIVTAKSVVTDLVQTVTGVRFGLFSFNSSSTGAKLVSPVGASVSSMVSAIATMTPDGYTPLGGAATDVQHYFQGTFISGGTALPSPIQYQCQKNYYIMMTDGNPNPEADSVVLAAATSLRTTDHSSAFSGTQNVVVDTIGFDIPSGAALLAQVASNGGGTPFMAANDVELKNSLQAAISAIVVDSYSFTQPLIPTASVSGTNRGYYASFQPDPARPFWRGFLAAYTRNSSGLIPLITGGIPDPAAQAWEAGAVLAAKSPASRTIFTIVSGARQDFLKTNGTITTGLLGVASGSEKDALIDFLRGIDTYDEDGDGNFAENRAWKLGDLYHSAPVLVGAPPLKSADTSYAAFRAARLSRTPILLVGANDGMLHAFRETDGEELWAFVPPDLLGSLKKLKPTGVAHPYFVDLSPIVTDVKIGSTWKTVVLIGERGGGRSYHALDISDTTSPTYLWSFTDAVMGETWSEPSVGRVRMSDLTTRTVAFVGGGYDSVNNNASGKAVFAIDLATGTKLWQYVATSGDSAYLNFSVAASPAVADLDGNGYADRLYVGDVGGQLWKFDLSAPATLAGSLVNNWTGKRLFAASPTQANPPPAGVYAPAQAMYERPSLAIDDQGALWVYVGTGDRNRPNDPSSNRFYGIKDDTAMTQGTTLNESSLVNATLTQATIGQGWYIPLSSREKVLSSPQVYDKITYFSSYTSNVAASCTNPSGVAKLYAVQMDRGDAAFDWGTGVTITGENGGTTSQTVGSGIPSDTGIVQGSAADAVIVATTEGEITHENRPPVTGKNLRYWKEAY